MTAARRSILFTGYAPVHFICFEPLYERLIRSPNIDIFVSGGLRTLGTDGFSYDGAALYGPLGIPEDRVLTIEEIGERDFDMVFAANTKMIEPRSVGRRVQIFHGVSFRNKAVRSANAEADHYFFVGPYMRRLFSQSGLIGNDDPRALEIGFPKTDKLLNGRLDRQALLTSLGVSGERPVILYAPTGQKHCSLETFGVDAVHRLGATGDYDVLVKLHDHPKSTGVDWPAKLTEGSNGNVKVVSEPDVVKLLFASNLLITDASSVSNEFSLLDRPMVFLDVPKLIAKAQKQAESQVDLETWGRKGGVVVTAAEQVVDTVAEQLEDSSSFSPLRREMSRDLFYNPGAATDAAMSWAEGIL